MAVMQSLVFRPLPCLRYGWDVAEERYPLPAMHQGEGELVHPPLEDLQWYELAFAAVGQGLG